MVKAVYHARGDTVRISAMLHGLSFSPQGISAGLHFDMADSVVFHLAHALLYCINDPGVSEVALNVLSQPAGVLDEAFSRWVSRHLTFCAVARVAESKATSFDLNSSHQLAR